MLAIATGLQAAALARLEPSESLLLEPLDAEAVAAIAALYAPPGSEIPAASCYGPAAASPRRVHEAASEWARRSATERVDTLAGRTAARRSQARALESELTGSVIDLQSTLERIEERPATPRSSARTRAWRASKPTTPSTSSAAKGSSRSSWPHLVGARLLGSSARPGAASPRFCARACCPRSRAGCCPAASTGRRP